MHRMMHSHGFDDYQAFHRWSVENAESFWQSLCDMGDIEFSQKASAVLRQPGNLMTARW